MENLIRPWVSVSSVPVERERTPPEQVSPPAHIRWGEASQFGVNDTRDQSTNRDFHTEDKPKPLLYGEYVEEGRRWTDFKYANPEDPGQFVILRKVNAIAFKALKSSAFSDDKRGEQVIFQFTSSFSADHERDYLKNTEGHDFEPLVLDPLHTIKEVGWSGPFALWVITWEPAVTGLANNAGVDHIAQLHLTQPTTVLGASGSLVVALAAASYGDPDIDAAVMYPPGETDVKKQWVRGLMQGSFPGVTDLSAHGSNSRFVNIAVWYINLAKMRSALAQDLADESQPYFEFAFRYGGVSDGGSDQQGSPIAYLGYGFYDGHLRSQVDGLTEVISDAMNAVTPESRTATQAMDLTLGILGSFKTFSSGGGSENMTANQVAEAPTLTGDFDHYLFRDNYPNVIEDA